MEALEQKTEKAIELYGNLVKAANRDYTHITKISTNQFNNQDF